MKSAPQDSGSKTGSRRAFVKKTATGTVLASTLGTTPFAILNPRAARSDGDKLGIALVGLGKLATQQIAPALAKTKPVTVRFFLERIVPEAAGLKASAIAGAELLYSLESNALLA